MHPAPNTLEGARRAAMPGTPRPMLASPGERVPEGMQWLHEIKLDGYRLLVAIRRQRVTLLTRGGHDWTARFGGIAAAAARLPVDEAVIDGEVVVLGPDGLSDFQALQNALASGAPRRPVMFMAFDLIHLDGWDLRHVPLVERKRALAALLEEAGHTVAVARGVRMLEHLRGDGERVRERACALGVEGVISKRADSHYEPGRRSPAWVKVRCLNVRMFAIVGYTTPKAGRTGFGALLLAEPVDGGDRLRMVGAVGTGFDERMLRELHERLRAIERPGPDSRIDERDASGASAGAAARRDAHWVKPTLHASVAFAGRTDTGQLRHATFRGLAEQREIDRQGLTSPAPPVPRTQRRRGAVEIAGVTITNPDKLYYPEAGLTKRDLVEYYAAVAAHALPHLADRPLALLRCPDGVSGECFFQKDHGEALGPGLDRVAIEHDEGVRRYAVVRSREGLVRLGQLGVLEVHPWGARADRPDRPDRLVLDLDPGPGVAWHEVVRTAHIVRELLAMLELRCFVRTTGGAGLHVVIPIDRRHTWDQAKQFTGAVAAMLERTAPDHYTASMTKARRSGRIYIDYLRNSRGATAIGAYAARARPRATVAMPMAWEELDDRLDPTALTIASVPRWLAYRRHDPWRELPHVRQRLTRSMTARLAA